ncbi:MAG: DNA-3-methyladenine glycosylase [Oscillospiraceae bacterium]|nr:DNA-3-methyladenine glycosylase [Oscillospiraceae bacterium]
MARWTQADYIGNVVTLARRMAGCFLVRQTPCGQVVCRIVETEAYKGATDRACHAFSYHKTARNAAMFGPPGTAYVYLIYGMHCCLNFVVNPAGEPDAVLLRAVECVEGADAMARLRYGCAAADMTPYQRRHLADGPGKCCKALSIDRSCNGTDITGDALYICTDLTDAGLMPDKARGAVRAGKRVGIDYAGEARDYLWRFTWEETPC